MSTGECGEGGGCRSNGREEDFEEVIGIGIWFQEYHESYKGLDGSGQSASASMKGCVGSNWTSVITN